MIDFNEEQYRSLAKEEILRCRPGDWEHAKRVVKWVKELGAGRDDLTILVMAAYIHDIGWRDVLPEGTRELSKQQLLELEPRANENTESFVTTFLKAHNYTEAEIKKVLELIYAADAHEAKNDFEAIIVDSDSLSKMDIDHLKEKYQPESWLEIHQLWVDEFPKRFKTKNGKKLFPALLKKLKQEILIELDSDKY